MNSLVEYSAHNFDCNSIEGAQDSIESWTEGYSKAMRRSLLSHDIFHTSFKLIGKTNKSFFVSVDKGGYIQIAIIIKNDLDTLLQEILGDSEDISCISTHPLTHEYYADMGDDLDLWKRQLSFPVQGDVGVDTAYIKAALIELSNEIDIAFSARYDAFEANIQALHENQ